MTVRKLVFLFVLYNIVAIVYYLFIIAGGWNVIKTVNIRLGLRNAAPSVFDTCPLKVLNHLDEELLHYHHPNYNPLKECRKYEPSVKLVSGQIVVPSNISNLTCKARCILHKPGDFGFLTDDWVELPSNHTFTCDIVESSCDRDGTIELYLHMQIYEKETNSKQSSIEESSGKKTSRHDVYVIILDSVSSFMIKRSFPKTLKFLKEEMGAVQMEFLDKVGDNSRANAFPLAFGTIVGEVYLGRSVQSGIRGLVDLPPIDPDWNDTEICAEPLDDYPFYLFQYAEVGYKTMTAQDYGVGFAFYPNCTGFIRDEADHVWVHFNNRRQNSTDFLMNRFRSCSERHLEMLEFLEKFMHAYPGAIVQSSAN
ncbi:unnamed protein product [Nippostrongylus brasiliensis]|uniref:Uncharacterized protein n=1 Tax=Nippostrongylus brasiliensis TaxID=27835 RepID=A0A0N4XHH1_NIPBR|nr:unnamed protein product [Nippostrongylus brasiliensis]